MAHLLLLFASLINCIVPLALYGMEEKHDVEKQKPSPRPVYITSRDTLRKLGVSWDAAEILSNSYDPETVKAVLNQQQDPVLRAACVGYVFMHAGDQGDTPMLAMLLDDMQANINATNQAGITVFHLAVQHRNSDLVRFLLGRGALINVRNQWHQHPLDHLEIRAGSLYALLKAHGALTYSEACEAGTAERHFALSPEYPEDITAQIEALTLRHVPEPNFIRRQAIRGLGAEILKYQGIISS
jgi:hypothetical protein